MKFWYTMFILMFIMVYGTLSLALLGNWAYAKARSLSAVRRPPASRKPDA